MGAQVIEKQWGVVDVDSDGDDKRQVVWGGDRERVTPSTFRTIYIVF